MYWRKKPTRFTCSWGVYWIPTPKGILFIVAHLSDQWKPLGTSEISYEWGALQNQQFPLASATRAELTSPFPSQTHRNNSIPSNIHLKSFPTGQSKPLPQQSIDVVVCCLSLLVLMLPFNALKNLIKRTTFAPRENFCVFQEPTSMWNDNVLPFKGGTSRCTKH